MEETILTVDVCRVLRGFQKLEWCMLSTPGAERYIDGGAWAFCPFHNYAEYIHPQPDYLWANGGRERFLRRIWKGQYLDGDIETGRLSPDGAESMRRWIGDRFLDKKWSFRVLMHYYTVDRNLVVEERIPLQDMAMK